MQEIVRWCGKKTADVPAEFLSFIVVCFADAMNLFRYVTYIHISYVNHVCTVGFNYFSDLY